MKKLFVFFVFIFITNAHAQDGIFGKSPIINLENFDKQRVHWGYFLGFNMYDFNIQYTHPQ